MSSTMSTLRMPNHTWSPSTSPTRPIRMSTTPKICANRLSTMSGEPPVRVAYVSRRKVYVLGHLVDAPLPTLIHPSAQKGNSRKFAMPVVLCGVDTYSVAYDMFSRPLQVVGKNIRSSSEQASEKGVTQQKI